MGQVFATVMLPNKTTESYCVLVGDLIPWSPGCEWASHLLLITQGLRVME